MKLPYQFYFFSLITIHVIYAMVFLGIFSTVPEYIYMWNLVVQIGLCLFLMFRYHPFRTHVFEPYDAKLIFGSAMLLLANVISLPLLYSYIVSQLKIDPLKEIKNMETEFLEKI
jgi:predicted membrane protein